MLLIKFGKREHLEQLKQGVVHFSPFESFQDDPTSFRGDKMEAKLFLDPSGPLLINGHDCSPYVKEVVFSSEFDGGVWSFSASMLSLSNCHLLKTGIYTPNRDYIEEMKRFGDYCLLLSAEDFIGSLQKSFEKMPYSCEFHPVTYIDKRDYDKVREYLGQLSEEDAKTRYLFIKDMANSYSLQNEWRWVIFGNQKKDVSSTSKGINIETAFSTQMPIFKSEDLFELQCSKELLVI